MNNTTATVNGQQVTGTVHAARVERFMGNEVLSPRCQRIGSATRCYLAAVDLPITCKRCIAKMQQLAK